MDIGQCGEYCVGPLTLYLKRMSDEWQLAHERQPDARELHRISVSSLEAIPASLDVRRFVFSNCPTSFRLQPALLDRPMVVKTRQPVGIPSGEQLTFYISSPLCLQIELQHPSCLLEELPVLRLSDTWFGPSTQVGELCYADRTHARHSKEELPFRPHRAVTPVTILNNAPSMLVIEKLSIPVPLLSVYGAADGALWTEPLSLQRDDAHGFAEVKIGKVADYAAGATLLAEPRRKVEKHLLVRAFAGIFAG